MRKSNETIRKIEEAKAKGFDIVGSGIGFGANWAQKGEPFQRGLEKLGYTEYYRIAKSNCRYSGYTKRLIYAAK